MNIGIVTCSRIPNLDESDKGLPQIFLKNAVIAEIVIWNDPKVQWSKFQFLIIRSIWDYHLHINEFGKWLDFIDKSNITTLNPIDIIRENRHKFYLRKLEENGIDIVPTIYIDKTFKLNLSIVEQTGWEKSIIKPAVSASAFMTELFDTSKIKTIENKYRKIAQERELLVQKFMPEINTFGELSVIFLNRKYSHTILKKAKPTEFRVQSDYGGTSEIFYPDDDIIKSAAQILQHYQGDILYARIDGIIKEAKFILMEIELIEPQLFLHYIDKGPDHFVDAALELMK